LRERQPLGHEVVVGDVAVVATQAGDVDLAPGAEQDAVGIDEQDFAVGLQLPEDLRGIAAGDPVERGARDDGWVKRVSSLAARSRNPAIR